jgi:hypothetical protein
VVRGNDLLLAWLRNGLPEPVVGGLFDALLTFFLLDRFLRAILWDQQKATQALLSSIKAAKLPTLVPRSRDALSRP